jgi:hypothetical protein
MVVALAGKNAIICASNSFAIHFHICGNSVEFSNISRFDSSLYTSSGITYPPKIEIITSPLALRKARGRLFPKIELHHTVIPDLIRNLFFTMKS